MRNIIPKSVQKLIDEFSKLPGIGPKTASRLTFYLLHKTEQDILSLGKAVSGLKEKIKNCPTCFSITDADFCTICTDPKRDRSKIMVVESPLDIIAIEKTQEYEGLYHVLGGVISPVDGIGPDDIRIKELVVRVEKDKISEVILATNPDLEGEATAMYIQKQILKPIRQPADKIRKNIEITRIARGLPVGGDLEYADEITLSRALEGRKEY